MYAGLNVEERDQLLEDALFALRATGGNPNTALDVVQLLVELDADFSSKEYAWGVYHQQAPQLKAAASCRLARHLSRRRPIYPAVHTLYPVQRGRNPPSPRMHGRPYPSSLVQKGRIPCLMSYAHTTVKCLLLGKSRVLAMGLGRAGKVMSASSLRHISPMARVRGSCCSSGESRYGRLGRRGREAIRRIMVARLPSTSLRGSDPVFSSVDVFID